MKDKLTIISDDLNHDIITELEARKQLLILLDVSKRFYVGCEISLKSNKYSKGIIISTARKRQGSIYWEVRWYDGEITKVREDTLNVC